MIHPEKTAWPGLRVGGQRLTGQGRLIHLHRIACQQTRIGRTMAPNIKRRTSPGTDPGAACHPLPVPLYQRVDGQLRFESRDGVPRLVLFPEPDDRIGDEQEQDDDKSGQCWTTPDRITVISIIHGMGPQKYPRNLSSLLVFFSSIWFGPYRVSRFSASACVRPAGDDSRWVCSSAMEMDLSSSWAAVALAASPGESGFDSGLDGLLAGFIRVISCPCRSVLEANLHFRLQVVEYGGLLHRGQRRVGRGLLRPYQVFKTRYRMVAWTRRA